MNWGPRDQPQSRNRQADTDELSPFRGVLAELEAVRAVPPADRGKAAVARGRFLSAAAGLRAARARRRLRWAPPFRRALLPLAALLVLVVAALGGLVAAAQTAWPDTPLYPVKTAWEDLRMALTPDPASRAALAAALIDERVTEIERLSAAGRPIPTTVLRRLDLQMRQALQAAAQLPAPQMRRFLQGLQETTTTQSQALERALQGAPPQNLAAITRGLATLTEARAWIDLGLQDPPAFRDVGGSAAGSPAALPTPTASPMTAGPTATSAPPPPLPSATPVPTPTAPPTHTPAPPQPEPTEAGFTVPPTPTPEPRQTCTPPAPGGNRTPVATRTAGPIHTPAPSEPTQTPGPPERTLGQPAQSGQPTRRP